MKLQEGQAIENIAFTATSELCSDLAAYRGKKVVIYFYPKDNTPGCTSESKDFTALHDQFNAKNTVIFGVSRDSLASHEKFKAKFDMPFELISDPDEVLCKHFDVIQLKKFMGKEYMGVVRSTFFIDENGVLEKVWWNVKVKGHAQAVLDTI